LVISAFTWSTHQRRSVFLVDFGHHLQGFERLGRVGDAREFRETGFRRFLRFTVSFRLTIQEVILVIAATASNGISLPSSWMYRHTVFNDHISVSIKFQFHCFAPAFRPYVMGHPTRAPRRIRSAAGIKSCPEAA
jgi:hypothetical protein